MRRAIVDLSHPITSGMPVYPGDPAVSLHGVSTVPDSGFAVASIEFGTHSGTHVDAPSHRVDGASAIDEADLEALLGPAVILRVPQPGPDEPITPGLVRDQLDTIRPGDIVLVATGWSSHFGSAMYLSHPFVTAELARELLARGVRVLGVDFLNPDRDGEHADGAEIHDLILGAGGYIVENLTNLNLVTWERPIVALLPLRLAGLDGSPIRAVALRPEAWRIQEQTTGG